jgi:hypothetical protein
MNQPHAQTTTRQEERIMSSLREQHALLLRLKELRRQGQHDEAQKLSRYLELLDQTDDWSMRYSA